MKNRNSQDRFFRWCLLVPTASFTTLPEVRLLFYSSVFGEAAAGSAALTGSAAAGASAALISAAGLVSTVGASFLLGSSKLSTRSGTSSSSSVVGNVADDAPPCPPAEAPTILSFKCARLSVGSWLRIAGSMSVIATDNKRRQ